MARLIQLTDDDDNEVIRADYFGDREFDVFGRNGDDTITMAGTKQPIGDPFAVRSGNDSLSGGNGDDTLVASEGDDELFGGANDDVLDGGVGDDVLDGGSNNDTLILSWGNDEYDGGSGHDILDASLMNLPEMAADLTPIFFDEDDPDQGMAGGVVRQGGVNLSLLSGVGFRLDEEGSQGQFSRLGRSTFANIEEFRFSDRNDTFTGNDDDHMILMGAGADTVFARGGADTIDGGAGADTIDGGDGIDTVTYSNSTAGVTVNLGDEPFQGTGSGGDAAGDRLIRVENFIGTRFIDIMLGNAVGNRLEGGRGNDVLWGRGGDDTLLGGNDNDLFVGGRGADIIDGGSGTDTADFHDLQDEVVITLRGAGDGTAVNIIDGTIIETDTLRSIENVNGSMFDDIITGDGEINILNGSNGNDRIDGGRGNDRIIGGQGNDTARFLSLTTGIVAELRDGAEATATAFLRDANGIVTEVETDTLVGIENLEGTNFGDYLNGDSGANILRGNGSSDVLFGGEGADTLDGGFGDDTFVLTDFEDTVIDASGIDTINSTVTRSLASHTTIENLKLLGSGNINATGNGLDNTLTGNSGDNILAGADGQDTLIGGLGDDIYVLADGSDAVADIGGIDTITSAISRNLTAFAAIENLTLQGTESLSGVGNGVENTIIGNSGDNRIASAGGADRLVGGAGLDILTGGTEDDTFVYLRASDSIGASRDSIQDFDDGGDDIIDLAALSNTVLGFRGTGAFTAANQVRANDIPGVNLVIEINLDANVATVEAEMILTITDIATITAVDFIL